MKRSRFSELSRVLDRVASEGELEFLQPGMPMQNGFIERFNRTYREEVLDMYVFNTIGEVREIPEAPAPGLQ